ncbi:PAS domain-containing protein [Streptomyces noursei]|uniref:PAS domain-containing protein n=1 Tax=Streptomyces noursei TaxID=1971 RepID=UPI0035714053
MSSRRWPAGSRCPPDPSAARTTALAARRVHRAAEFPLADGRIIRRETAPLYDADGRPFGSLWTAEDVTEGRRREHAPWRTSPPARPLEPSCPPCRPAPSPSSSAPAPSWSNSPS